MTETIEQPAIELTVKPSRHEIPYRERWICIGEVAALVGLSTSQVSRNICSRPDFPAPVRVGKPRWPAGEVIDWLHARRADTASTIGSTKRRRRPANRQASK